MYPSSSSRDFILLLYIFVSLVLHCLIVYIFNFIVFYFDLFHFIVYFRGGFFVFFCQTFNSIIVINVVNNFVPVINRLFRTRSQFPTLVSTSD